MKISKRRQFLSLLGLGGLGLGGVGLGGISTKVQAHHTETHFEDSSKHRLLYQCNKADIEYIDHILFSCGEMLRKYGDDIEIIVTTLGPGIHLLAKHPRRLIKPEQQQRVKSLAAYGVRFQACGNTMKTLQWSDEDMLAEAEIIPIGVEGIMKLQEQGFTYFSW